MAARACFSVPGSGIRTNTPTFECSFARWRRKVDMTRSLFVKYPVASFATSVQKFSVNLTWLYAVASTSANLV